MRPTRRGAPGCPDTTSLGGGALQAVVARSFSQHRAEALPEARTPIPAFPARIHDVGLIHHHGRFTKLQVPHILAGILPGILAGLKNEARSEGGMAGQQRRTPSRGRCCRRRYDRDGAQSTQLIGEASTAAPLRQNLVETGRVSDPPSAFLGTPESAFEWTPGRH